MNAVTKWVCDSMVRRLLTGFMLTVYLAVGQATDGAASELSVVLLSNGNLLKGRVTRTGDGWKVDVGPKSHVILPASEVQGVFRSIGDVFQWRRSRIAEPSADGLISLGFWALRHDYAEGTVAVLAECEAKSIDDPRLDVLEAELRRRRESTERVVRPPASHEVMDPAALRHESVAEFRKVIEPLLVQSCGQSGCHGPGGVLSFRLVRPHPSGADGLEIGHNLRTTLHQIDAAKLMRSPLLRFAVAAHGGDSVAAPISTSSREYQLLAQWLSNLRNDPRPALKTVSSKVPVSRVLYQQPPVPLRLRAAASRPTESTVRPSSDPYDPEVFNHR